MTNRNYDFSDQSRVLALTLISEEMRWELKPTTGTRPNPRGFPSLNLVNIDSVWHILIHGGQFRRSQMHWTFYNDVFLLNLGTVFAQSYSDDNFFLQSSFNSLT